MSNLRGQKKQTETAVKAEKKRENRVRIRLTAYDHRVLDISTEKILEVLKNDQGKLVGPVPLPTKIRRFCVLRSPHVDKKSREHFEMRIHRRLIDIIEPGQEFATQLSRLDLPAGVDIEVKL
ncbi:MAG: 30S ribosomal protein S10 [Vampirovibrionales bacterium]